MVLINAQQKMLSSDKQKTEKKSTCEGYLSLLKIRQRILPWLDGDRTGGRVRFGS